MTAALCRRTVDPGPSTRRRSLRCAGAFLALVATMSAGVLAASAPPASATTAAPGWSGTGAVLLSSAPAGSQGNMVSVSCPAPGNCVSVGAYDSGPGTEDVIDTRSGGNWEATSAPLPPGSNATPSVLPVRVDCPSVGPSAAAGGYNDGAANGQGVVEVLAGGS